MRLLPHRIYLLALEGRKTLHGRSLPSKNDAHDSLCRLTGQDFGFDVDAWKGWIRKNRKGLYGKNPGPIGSPLGLMGRANLLPMPPELSMAVLNVKAV